MLVEGSFTLKIESEDDILLIADLIQRKKGKKSENSNILTAPNIRREREAGTDTKDRIRNLLYSKFPTGEFRREQVFALVTDKSRSTVDAALRSLVREGRLFKVRSAVFTFEKRAPSLPNVNSLLELQTDKPAFLDVLRIMKALADKVPLSIYRNGMVSRQSDTQGHIALSVNVDKSHFHVYDVKTPMDLLVDASSLLERLHREPGTRIAMLKAGALQIGNFSLNLDKCQSIQVTEPPEAMPAIESKSELVISRQALERILSDNKVNSDYVDIIAEQGHVLFQSFNEKGDYPGVPISTGYTCKEPTRSRLHYLDYLLKAVKASKCETVRLKNGGSFLVAEFQIDQAIQCSLFLACKPLQVEEVSSQ